MEKRGAVTSLFISPEQGASMQKVSQVHAVEGGLDGDRYQKGEGFWQTVPKPRETVRDVSLISLEAIEEANREFGTDFEPQDTRRQIVVSGVGDLNELVDKEFQVGEVKMRGVEPCTPCKRPSQLSGKEGFEKAFKNRGGLRAKILTSGTIYEGDEIKI